MKENQHNNTNVVKVYQTFDSKTELIQNSENSINTYENI